MCLVDSGNSVRGTDYVSAFPPGTHVGASWNKELAHRRAYHMGREAKIKGVSVLHGPSIGPIGRVVSAGRNWEVEGIQENGVITSTKHFIAQEQETHRLSTRDDGPFQEAISSNVDDRTMHELYLWPFYDAVKAGTANIMCSYNRLNNSYVCKNSKSQNGLLKEELGFQADSFDSAVEGHVLVKNEKNALPLRSENMKLISLFGYSTRAPSSNTPVPAANGTRFASWEMGIRSANITEVDLGWFGNLDLPTSDIAINGTVISAGGSAAPSWSLISAPCDALVAQAYEDGTALLP
ncbi:hypothetical protein VDGE_30739 [Verticillium dahliae]|uniref:beta-glucosidase n=1 Tax=Verticillium dahliae TaxID=27337 RepID=A0A444RIP5_VERDA|nr:hypothetical protein VDGE_30739 [Verticillium dahliae]